MNTIASEFKQYRRTNNAEMTPWRVGFDMSRVSVSWVDGVNGSPKPGDMIARNPMNHADLWLVAAQYFMDNFEAATTDQHKPERQDGDGVEGAGECPAAGCGEVVGDTKDPRWDQGQCAQCGKWFWKSTPPKPARAALSAPAPPADA